MVGWWRCLVHRPLVWEVVLSLILEGARMVRGRRRHSMDTHHMVLQMVAVVVEGHRPLLMATMKTITVVGVGVGRPHPGRLGMNVVVVVVAGSAEVEVEVPRGQ